MNLGRSEDSGRRGCVTSALPKQPTLQTTTFRLQRAAASAERGPAVSEAATQAAGDGEDQTTYGAEVEGTLRAKKARGGIAAGERYADPEL